jgi:hypothetical protein
MNSEEVQTILEKSPGPRVTEEHIKKLIKHVRYYRDDFTTIAVLTLKNGFKVIGHSTPASTENFDTGVGQHYAYENAFRQIWQLEGYLLKEVLSS